jgi:hypothetical protein
VGLRSRVGEWTVVGRELASWPDGEPQFRVRGGQAGHEILVGAADLRALGEFPDVPYELGRDAAVLAKAEELAQAHFDRRNDAAGRAGRELGALLTAGMDERALGSWWRVHQLAEPAEGTSHRDALAAAFGRMFEGREQDAAVPAALRAEAGNALRTLGLPEPDWSDGIVKWEPGGAIPPGEWLTEANLRATWEGQFGSRGYRAAVRQVTINSGGSGATVKGNVLNSRGTNVGTFTRNITARGDGSFEVYHAYLQINAGSQGGGFAREFNRHAERVYRAKGVTKVTVSADIDIGGYAWAATGFDFNVSGATPEARAKARAEYAYSMAYNRHRSGRLSAAEWALVEPLLYKGGPGETLDGKIQHAWELAWLPGGREGDHSIGKKILLGTSWSGVKHLTPELEAERGGEAPRVGSPPEPSSWAEEAYGPAGRVWVDAAEGWWAGLTAEQQRAVANYTMTSNPTGGTGPESLQDEFRDAVAAGRLPAAASLWRAAPEVDGMDASLFDRQPGDEVALGRAVSTSLSKDLAADNFGTAIAMGGERILLLRFDASAGTTAGFPEASDAEFANQEVLLGPGRWTVGRRREYRRDGFRVVELTLAPRR